MTKILGASLRYSGAGLLWVLIALLVIPSLICHWVSGAGLYLIAELKAAADRLIDGARS